MTETLSSKDGRTVLRMERQLAHPPEKVWRALTDPAELAGWFPAAVELDLRLGGQISFHFPDGEDDFVEDPDNTGVIRSYEPPKLLEYKWGAELHRWELSAAPDGCLLVLTATYDDRPGSASFTAGWLGCFAALDQLLGGPAVPPEDYADLHEHFVKVYRLDQGEVIEGPGEWIVRFERQLVRPKEEVWSTLAGAADVATGAAPPAGFVANGIEPTKISAVTAPTALDYESRQGKISWHLRDGNGGARLVLTHTCPPDLAEPSRQAWRHLIESLATDLLTQGSPS